MKKVQLEKLRDFLDRKVQQYNRPEFIELDPVCVPHRFSKLQDIEISAFFSATLAWGQRKTIISKSLELMSMMDFRPHEFILHHSEKELEWISRFKHRTFNGTDTLYFIDFLRRYYKKHQSLEEVFSRPFAQGGAFLALTDFQHLFFDVEYAPGRTKKHVSSPAGKSACKRLNMFLRWMVRQDNKGVDFGLWESISPSLLICPVDLHVERIARRFSLITRKSAGWQMAEELTANLRNLDAADPVKYDFALFGLGVMED